MNKKVFGGMCIFLAVVSVIFAVVSFTLSDGYFTTYESYGGDAYTGIQQAAADTARNVLYMHDSICTISGLAFILVALILGSVGIGFITVVDAPILAPQQASIIGAEPAQMAQTSTTPSQTATMISTSSSNSSEPAVPEQKTTYVSCRCEHCGNLIRTISSLKGKKIVCTHCHQVTTVTVDG